MEPLVNQQGRTVCTYNLPERKAVKFVKRSVHFMHKYQAWALDEWAFEKLKDLGIEVFEITDAESGVTFSTTLLNWEQNKGRFDYGYNPQVYLYIKHWSRSDDAQLTLW